MREAHDDAAFLTGSPTRASVLAALVERPHTRTALADATGASQPTLTRTLTGLADRGWILNEDDTFRATVLGRLVAGRYDRFLDTLGVANQLAVAAPHLPTDSFTFDLDCLLDADIHLPSASDPLAPTRAASAQVRNADDVRILTHQVAPDTIDSLFERAGEQTVRGVVTPDVVEMIRDDDALASKTTAVARDGMSVRVLDEVPFVLAVCDDVVGMGVPDRNGAPTAVIESRNDDVLAWALETFEDHWNRAELLEFAGLDG